MFKRIYLHKYVTYALIATLAINIIISQCIYGEELRPDDLKGFRNDSVHVYDKQGFVITRFDDTGLDKLIYGFPLFYQYQMPFENCINVSALDFTSDVKIKYLQWMALGYEPQDHTPYHYTVVPPRVRDPFWSGMDDGYHYLYADSLHDYGSWKDHVYIPARYYIPMDTELDSKKYYESDKVYFNLSPIIKNWLASNCTLNPAFWRNFAHDNEYYYELAGRNLSWQYYDTLYFFGKNARDFIRNNFMVNRDYQTSSGFNLVGFGNAGAMRQLLVSYKKTMWDSLGVNPSVFVHPGGRHKVNFITGKFAEANKSLSGGRLYEYAFVGDFGFTAPSKYGLYGIGVDSALALTNYRCELGYNMIIDDDLLCGLGYNTSQDETIETTKKNIVDIIAKHKVAVLGYHFNGWDTTRWRILLDFIREKGIPVVSEKKAYQIITGLKSNSFANIIPRMDRDLNVDGIPDGWGINGIVSINNKANEEGNTIPFNKYYSLLKNSSVSIEELFGVERKVINRMSLWIRGKMNDSLIVTITENKLSNRKLERTIPMSFRISLVKSDWDLYSFDWMPGENVNNIHSIKITNYGELKDVGLIENRLVKKLLVSDNIAPPTKLQARQLNDGIELFWQSNSSSSEHDIIERSWGDSTRFFQIGIVPRFTNVFIDRDVVDNVKYFYKVCSTKDSMMSAYSNIALTHYLSIMHDSQKINDKDEIFTANYPNPFNQTTTIIYNVPKESKVSITVKNVLGQVIESSDLGVKKIGIHKHAFSIASQRGRVASGVYLYTIDIGYERKTNKMIYVK